jgi:hypothetical protein
VLQELQKQMNASAADVIALKNKMHPKTLEYLGDVSDARSRAAAGTRFYLHF